MSEPSDDHPTWNTNILWGVLAVLLVFGCVGGATFVYGLLSAVSGSWPGLILAAVGATVAFLAFLFMVGILYRVDRYRGANGRRVELFE